MKEGEDGYIKIMDTLILHVTFNGKSKEMQEKEVACSFTFGISADISLYMSNFVL